jgi:hypothetical protein
VVAGAADRDMTAGAVAQVAFQRDWPCQLV